MLPARSSLAAVKRHAEHLINITEGEGGPDYGDADANGRIEDPGDGIGLRARLDAVVAVTPGQAAEADTARAGLDRILALSRLVVGADDIAAASAPVAESGTSRGARTPRASCASTWRHGRRAWSRNPCRSTSRWAARHRTRPRSTSSMSSTRPTCSPSRRHHRGVGQRRTAEAHSDRRRWQLRLHHPVRGRHLQPHLHRTGHVAVLLPIPRGCGCHRHVRHHHRPVAVRPASGVRPSGGRDLQVSRPRRGLPRLVVAPRPGFQGSRASSGSRSMGVVASGARGALPRPMPTRGWCGPAAARSALGDGRLVSADARPVVEVVEVVEVVAEVGGVGSCGWWRGPSWPRPWRPPRSSGSVGRAGR